MTLTDTHQYKTGKPIIFIKNKKEPYTIFGDVYRALKDHHPGLQESFKSNIKTATNFTEALNIASDYAIIR